MLTRLLRLTAAVLLLCALLYPGATQVSYAQGNQADSVQAEIDNAQSLALKRNQDSQESCAKFIGACWYWWASGGVLALIVVAIVYGNRRDRSGLI